jgi:cytidyltransferase-like protein
MFLKNKNKIPIGIAQGRFHIIHWGHMEYLLKAKEKCEHLVIGITDCDPERAYFQYGNEIKEFDKENLLKPFRSFDNPIFPFTFYDRMQMIRDSLIDEGVNAKEFDIVPFPVHKLHIVKYYIPLNATIFATVYDDWGRKKIEIFKNMGFNVKILWERTLEERFTTGTEVRKRIIENEKWEHLVPAPVYKYIKIALNNFQL